MDKFHLYSKKVIRIIMIYVLFQTEQPATRTADNEKETINENILVAETRGDIKSTPTPRPRPLQCEVKEAGKHVKEAITLLQRSINKRDSEASQDDCSIYALGLAKKLRAFSEEERMEIMYDIDGMILTRRRAKHPSRFTATPLISPSQYSQCSSPMSSYSEPLSSGVLYNQDSRISYTQPVQINVSQEQHTRQMYSPEIQPQDTTTETGSNVCIISDQSLEAGHQLSDIIAQAYNTA